MDPHAVRDAARTWDSIAASFDRTRAHSWPVVLDYLRTVPRGGRVLDAGCGNGRHSRDAAAMGLRPIGLDLSRALLDRARAHAPSAGLIRGLLEAPPLKDGRFDAALCVASLHHVRGRPQRVDALRSLEATLRPRATMLLLVWSADQARFRDHPPRAPEGMAEAGDALVPWTEGARRTDRFVHLYRPGELEQEAADAGLRVLERRAVAIASEEPDNHLAVVEPSGR